MNELTDLADIVDPVAPIAAASGSGVWLAGLIALLALVATLMVWWKRGAPRRRTLRHVRRLQRELAAGAIDARELAYGIAAELQVCLRLRRLRTSVAPAVRGTAQRAAWPELVARLDALRYQSDAAFDAVQIERLVRDSVHWLRRAR